MSCCSNPIDLGCKNYCAPITTNIIVSAGETHIVAYRFNGKLITHEITSMDAGYLVIPAGIFNEVSNITFNVHDSSGNFIACFKIEMSSGGTTVEMNKPQPALPVNTVVNFIPDRCTSDVYRGIIQILFSDMNAIKNGVVIDLHHEILHNGTSTPHSINPGSMGYTYVNDLITITDETLLGGQILLGVLVTSKNCTHKFTIDAVVDNMQNLPPAYFNNINTPMPEFNY